MPYKKKARLIHEITEIDQYRPILDKDAFKDNELHWNSISKNTITLFQVLIDQDLSHLVMVLEAYPRYIPIVCDHFRYAYSYSEKSADIDAASKLLTLGEAYFTKQFVRNVIRKLPQIPTEALEELILFVNNYVALAHQWHPIIRQYYYDEIITAVNTLQLHPLQRISLTKGLKKIKQEPCFSFDAADRDKALDIPYMD